MKGTTRITAEEFNKIHGCTAMGFDERLLARIKQIGLVRRQYAIDWLNSGTDTPLHEQAMEGLNWCNRELEKTLHIIGEIE